MAEPRHAPAQRAAKAAFKAMMDAATKAANLADILGEECADPKEAANWKHSAHEWQNTASEALKHWREL